jgi:hypothetical protein
VCAIADNWKETLKRERRILSGLVNPVMPTLNQLFDKVLAIPGVADVLKPAIDALRLKLAALTA